MRIHHRSIVPLAFVIALVVSLGAQDLFYDAYERGLKAFDAGNWAVARQMFERALQLDSKQGRRKRFQGMVFKDYLPEYYLGLVSVKEKRFDDALAYLKKVESSGLIKQNDREYATLVAERAAAQSALQSRVAKAEPPAPIKPSPPVVETPRPVPPPAVTRSEAPPAQPSATPPAAVTTAPPVTLPPAPPGVRTTAMGSSELQGLSERVTQALQSGDFEGAWEAAQRASALPGVTATARSLMTQVRKALAQTAERRLRQDDIQGASRIGDLLSRVAPASAENQQLRRLLDARREQLRGERDTFRTLLLGDYRRVGEIAAPLLQANRATARLIFYAACGRAGESLTAAADSRNDLASDARRLYERASRSGVSFAKEKPYISPEILALLKKP